MIGWQVTSDPAPGRLGFTLIGRAALTLVMTVTACYAATLRLRGGDRPTEGEVQVLMNGEWGSVCDDSWSLQDANVACRQLGFKRALAAYGQSMFGRVQGRIWLSAVNCHGNERALQDCQAVVQPTRCGPNHGRVAAGVRCLPKKAKKLARKGQLNGVHIIVSNAITVSEGSTLLAALRCHVNATVWEETNRFLFTVYEIYWERNGVRLITSPSLTVQEWPPFPDGDSTNGGRSAHLRWVTYDRASSGNYTCVVQTAYGEIRNETYLRVLEAHRNAPKLNFQEQELRVYLGYPYMLPCKAYGGRNLKASLYYLQGGKWFIGLESSSKVQMDDNGHSYVDSSIYVKKAYKDQEQLYVCQGRNAYGKSSHRFRVIVQEPRLSLSGKVLLNDTNTLIKWDGNNASIFARPPSDAEQQFTLTCQAWNGAEQPIVQWYKDKVPLGETIEDKRAYHITNSYYNETGRFSVRSTVSFYWDPLIAGVYHCMAAAAKYTRYVQYHIKLGAQPEISSTAACRLPQQAAVYKATVKGLPTTKLSLRVGQSAEIIEIPRESGRALEQRLLSQQLKISSRVSVNADTVEIEVCQMTNSQSDLTLVANNTFGEVTHRWSAGVLSDDLWTVRQVPKEQVLNVITGSDIVFQCIVDGLIDRTMNITWFYLGTGLTSTRQLVVPENVLTFLENRAVSRLHMKSVSTLDSGVYICHQSVSAPPPCPGLHDKFFTVNVKQLA